MVTFLQVLGMIHDHLQGTAGGRHYSASHTTWRSRCMIVMVLLGIISFITKCYFCLILILDFEFTFMWCEYHLLTFAPYAFIQPFALNLMESPILDDFHSGFFKDWEVFIFLSTSFTVADTMFAPFLLTSVTTHFVSSALLKNNWSSVIVPLQYGPQKG